MVSVCWFWLEWCIRLLLQLCTISMCYLHESQWSGHLGITKNYQLILRHFLARFKKRCCRHVCQITGKPTKWSLQLHYIAINKKWKSVFTHGHVCCHSLSWSCPLCKITANSLVKVLTKFYSTFGLLCVIHTDQGTNFWTVPQNVECRSHCLQRVSSWIPRHIGTVVPDA